METLSLRRESAKKSLTTLKDAIDAIADPSEEKNYERFRDSMIQRFEFSIDTLWKFLREYLEHKFGVKIEIVRPKIVFKECKEVNLISAYELKIFNDIVEARNISSYIYNEDLAEEISKEIPKYYELMKKVFDKAV